MRWQKLRAMEGSRAGDPGREGARVQDVPLRRGARLKRRGRKVDYLPPQRRPNDRKGNGGKWTTSRHYAVPTTNTPLHELDLTAPHEAGLDSPEPRDDPWGDRGE